MVPLVPAAPGLLGFGPTTALGSLAGFLAAHPFLHHALVLPIETARDAGDTLLVGRLLLLAGAGLASATLLRTLGLGRAALAGGVLYELAAAANGTGGRRALAALILAPFFLACVEQTVRGLRPSTLRLGVAISLVASLETNQAACSLVLFGFAWAAVRLASSTTILRLAVLARLAVGVFLGILLASPFLLPHLLLTDVRWSAPRWLDGVWRAAPPAGSEAGRTLVELLPTVGLALLAAWSGRRRGRLLLTLLAAGALAVASASLIAGINSLADSSCRPLFLTSLVVLCAAPPSVPLPTARVCLATGLALSSLASAAVLFDHLSPVLASANAAWLIAVVALAAGGHVRSARAGAIASAAWTALAAAS